MTKIEEYRAQLRDLKAWVPFLQRQSGLPGPRGNLELAAAFVQEASARQILELADISLESAPKNTPRVFLAFCGVMGVGKLIAEGGTSHFAALRGHASDPRGEFGRPSPWDCSSRETPI